MVILRFFSRDSLRLGFGLGLLAPLLSLGLYYYINIYPNTITDFFRFLWSEKRLLSSLTVICLVLNIALFTAYINTRRDQTAKGIFAITIVYALGGLLAKMIH